MTRKNDIFLIMAYTPDRFKENLLRDLINGLRELDQDILLVSHTIQSQDIIDSVDYYLYDKENELLYDPEIKYFYFCTVDEYKIFFKDYFKQKNFYKECYK